MANAMVALANITLGASQSTVTFSNIPTTGFRDLRLVSNVVSLSGSPTTVGSYLQFNGDTGSNYSSSYAYGNGSSAGAGTEVNQPHLFWGAFPLGGGMDHMDILDYSVTDKHKCTIARADGPANNAWIYAGRWASTTAITSITLTSPDTGGKTFGAGSSFSLFGIVSA